MRLIPTTLLRILAVLAPLMTVLCASAHAGHILQIEDDIAYVGMGASDGVGPGSDLTLLHTVVADNPKGGKSLEGTFPIGTLKVLRVGEHLCAATIDGSLRHRLRVGAVVRLDATPRVFHDPWSRNSTSDPTQPSSSSQDRVHKQAQAQAKLVAGETLSAAFTNSLGKSVEERLLVWQEFSRSHPTLNRQLIDGEIAALQAALAKRDEVVQNAKDPLTVQRETRFARLESLEAAALDSPLTAQMPGKGYEQTALEVAFWADPLLTFDKATLYYRGSSSDSYQWTSLSPDGDGYLRGTIPANVIAPPTVEYFVELADSISPPRATLGTMDAPISVIIEPSVVAQQPERKGRSQIRLFTDYVDFDGGLRGGYDQYVHMEGDFMYRFYKPVYSVRVGFGSLSGSGGPKDVIDESPDCLDSEGEFRCRRVNYNFVYTEFEFRLGKLLAFMIRPQFGTGSRDLLSDGSNQRCKGADTEGCDFFHSFGARGRIRFGDEMSSNLTLGFGVVGELGTVFEAAFTWDAIEKVPIVLSAQVADQPVPEDFGVRLIADVGWRELGWIYPSLRISYQARDVDHDGISGGAAVNFDW